ncbi:MAG: DUF6967 family protein [Alphaproteobacteria bacterium]
MSAEQDGVADLDHFLAPWGKEITLQTVDYESGLKMVRITIREKRRFTTLDLDLETTTHLVQRLSEWAEVAKREMPFNSPPTEE